jgi:hypothetical protein
MIIAAAIVHSGPEIFANMVKPNNPPMPNVHPQLARADTSRSLDQRQAAYKAAVPNMTTPASVVANRPCASKSGSKLRANSANNAALCPHRSFAQRKTTAPKSTVNHITGIRLTILARARGTR